MVNKYDDIIEFFNKKYFFKISSYVFISIILENLYLCIVNISSYFLYKKISVTKLII